jgi:4-amino-4-deoxychorismate lyase
MNAPPPAALINGRPGEQVSAAERALHYGDGLFETISCVQGRARWLSRHLQRLRLGCERLQLPFTEYAALEQEIAALARRVSTAAQRCIVKVIISRGVAVRRGYRPSGEELPTRIVTRHEWPTDDSEAAALQVSLSSVRLGTNPLLAGLKHLNRLEQVLAQLARPSGIDEVLMLSSRGEVIGGSMTNVFFVDDVGAFTPRLDACGVAGIMRGLVLQASRKAGAARIRVRRIRPLQLATVREAFLTNVRWGIRSIGSLDGRTLPSDDYAQQLRRQIDAAQS